MGPVLSRSFGMQICFGIDDFGIGPVPSRSFGMQICFGSDSLGIKPRSSRNSETNARCIPIPLSVVPVRASFGAGAVRDSWGVSCNISQSELGGGRVFGRSDEGVRGVPSSSKPSTEESSRKVPTSSSLYSSDSPPEGADSCHTSSASEGLITALPHIRSASEIISAIRS